MPVSPSPMVQVRGQRLQPWPHVTALLSRPQLHAAVAVFSTLLPFYSIPCSAVFRLWRIALAPGFAGPLCCIASIQHARSHDTRGFRPMSLSLSQTRQAAATTSRRFLRSLLGGTSCPTFRLDQTQLVEHLAACHAPNSSAPRPSLSCLFISQRPSPCHDHALKVPGADLQTRETQTHTRHASHAKEMRSPGTIRKDARACRCTLHAWKLCTHKAHRSKAKLCVCERCRCAAHSSQEGSQHGTAKVQASQPIYHSRRRIARYSR
jgi:hypothetical protein